ncbi:hypothetical protein DASC09_038240 [Saccharomycopsis crataegensis]|uniref:NGG1-interacting factor 3 n=1 Tax=Saccharomycopsis crataegensis TaxID=43959 RepID=A0AAV5QPA6_9ASCO|nr:hypothetical protein DASC09_038240 [Saccharomycopsis crataegensis]
MSSKSALKTAVSAIQKLYPIELAERSWDNVGLLVDSTVASTFSESTSAPKPFKILLAIDLTRAVCREAVQKRVNLILAYHPFIFRGLKQIGSEIDPQQVSLVEIIKNNINVYCPHTSVDAVKGGVNDWLVESIVNGDKSLIKSSKPIDPSDGADMEENGMGRYVELNQPLKIFDIVSSIKSSLNIPYLQLASAQTPSLENHSDIQTVAICAGSGGELFKRYLNNPSTLPDLIYTGELSHHEILAFKERGCNVIVCNHSNTERGYLKTISKLLKEELSSDYSIEISYADKDPLQVV